MLSAAKRIVKSIRKESRHVISNAIDGKDARSGEYIRVLQVRGYPPVILAGYLDTLDSIVKSEGATLRKTIRYASSTVRWNRGMKYKLDRLNKSIDDQSLHDPARKEEVAARDTIMTLREAAYNDNSKLLDVWTFLTVAAPKRHIVDAVEAKLRDWFDNLDGVLDDLRREQVEALRQLGPVADPETAASRFFYKHHYGRVTTDSVAARTYPMTRGTFSDNQGLYFGRRSEDGGFCFINLCDPTDSNAQNIAVFGKTGEGKSFFMKALVESLLEEGVHVFVFDLDGEWRDLCEKVGGVYIDHTADEGRYFEPLMIMPRLPELDADCVQFNRSRLTRAIDNTVRTLSLLADGLTRGELFEAGQAVRRVLEAAGIRREEPNTWDAPYTGPEPTIHGVFREIEEASKQGFKDADSLYDKIKIYFIGIYDHLFLHRETMGFHRAPLVVYKVGSGETEGDDKDLRAQQAQIKMSMAFDIVNANIQFLKFEGASFSAVLVDEGQRQMKNAELRRAIFEWYTAIRKWNGMMILGSNTPAVMLETPEGIGCYENTSVKVFFYMETSAVRLLHTHADMPVEIQQRISQNQGTRRFILQQNRQYDELFMDVPEEEAKLYKTRGLKRDPA